METLLGFSAQAFTGPIYLTIGNFDGVHRGHQALISDMAKAAHAAGAQAGLLTFEPHPLTILRPGATTLRLTSNEERASLLAALGLDFVLVLPFTRATADTSAAEFMSTLVGYVQLKELWIGPDFALGRGREGNAARLTALGQDLGYQVQVVPPYHWLGEQVRSSRVRAYLADDGAVESAATLLGRPYQLWGQVTQGARRGRRLGFPTANMAVPDDRLTPAHGVYACWAWRDARENTQAGYPAVVNIGVRPSFDNGPRSVEAYLLDFTDDLYGEMLGLSFIQRLRGEMRFNDVSALISQIKMDAEAARALLADPPDDTGNWKLEAGSWKLEAGTSFWGEIPHTADWAIRVTGVSPRQLFARTAAVMYLLQGADPSQPITLARSIEAEAANTPELLVAWLNRLLVGQDIGQELYTRFEIHEISERGLRGVAYGYRGTPTHTTIKAVTYYDLSAAQTAEGWEAIVTFDV